VPWTPEWNLLPFPSFPVGIKIKDRASLLYHLNLLLSAKFFLSFC
jgi:hypothetical protein